MLRSNNKISFASLSTGLGISSWSHKDPTLESGVSKVTKMSGSKGGCSVREEQCKVVKLIGDKQQNIEEIMGGIACVCGCKGEFRNILNLLMSKIYRLREERNFYREQAVAVGQGVAVGVNTEDAEVFDPAEELRKLIEDSKSGLDHSVRYFRNEDLDEVIPLNRLTSITFQEEANETNLLEDVQDGQWDSRAEYSKLSFEEAQEGVQDEGLHEGLQEGVLQEYDSNADPRNLNYLRSYFKQNSLSLNKLESYIQKLKCARQLDKYEIDKRNKAIF